MITLTDTNQKIQEIQHIGTFTTPNGMYTVLTITIKHLRRAEQP